MFNTIGKITLALLLSLTLWSCDNSQVPTDISVPSAKEAQVYLSFSIGVVEAVDNMSRASIITKPDDSNKFEEGTGCEDINTLRVIIVRANNVVEYNRQLPEDDIDKVNDFPVAPGERKTIYLIANEKVTGIDFDQLAEGELYPTNAIENMTLETASGYLIDNTNKSEPEVDYVPMSEFYSIYVPPFKECKEIGDGKRAISAGTLFVTRAAVKFTFIVKGSSDKELYIKSLTFNSLARKEYLLPRNTIYFPPKEVPELTTNLDQSNPVEGHFITSYTIPVDTKQEPFVFDFSSGAEPKGRPFTKDTPAKITPAMYFCESQVGAPYPKADGSPYTVSIEVCEKNSVNPKSYEAVELPNLPILPRNTHVVVNITVNQSSVDAVVELVPYIGVTLKPEFGFDELVPTKPNDPRPGWPEDPDAGESENEDSGSEESNE